MNLSDEASTRHAIKLVLMSVSGGGKTSAIIPLAIPEIIPGWPGKKLFVRNFDGRGKFSELALEQLTVRLKSRDTTRITKEQFNAAKANIEYVDCIDPRGLIGIGGNEKIGRIGADAWVTARKTYRQWEKDLCPGTILVDDSLTFMAEAIAAYTMATASRLNFTMEGYKDYAPAQAEINNALGMLGALRCDVILTAHQESYEVKKTSETPEHDPKTGFLIFKEEVVDSLMLPTSTGQKGRTSIPAQFNHMLYLATSNRGVRELRTSPGRGIIPKTPFFGRCKASYTLDTGLVEYFLLGEKPTN